ncbi:type II secretion system protein GspL [Parathalassolituus penaei]|uniref:Type II secretion system protein L n=1 Tax=Parathalassolituus penaei TaxID=2997323 RepID=A0A9X3EJL0_9GAMM|nr:type II secretion system protein GspL [Parathalassolituus penaei]MCY0965491.1 type II secretion system protein GspL [Parathalassolituus penaei]
MLTVKVSWHALTGSWMVQPLQADETTATEATGLHEWASAQPDLVAVRMVLAATNYSCFWVEMPGVSNRHLARALPFALEEHLVSDPSDYLIVTSGRQAGRVRAYAADRVMVRNLLDVCEAHHIQVRELLPETALLADETLALGDKDGWLLRLPGRFEGWIPAMAISAVMESVLDGWTAERLLIACPGLDQAQLLKTTIDTSFPGVFEDIQLKSGQQPAQWLTAAPPRTLSFLTGEFQPRDSGDNRPRAWWRPLAVMTAACLVVLAVDLAIDNYRMRQQASDVYGQSLALYKKLFPGERIRSLERDFRAKLSGTDGAAVSTGFVSLINRTAKGCAGAGVANLQVTSIRFSDRQQELIVEVQAQNLNDLQTLRQALEKQGLLAEVSSANNDKNIVKGRLKVGESS